MQWNTVQCSQIENIYTVKMVFENIENNMLLTYQHSIQSIRNCNCDFDDVTSTRTRRTQRRRRRSTLKPANWNRGKLKHLLNQNTFSFQRSHRLTLDGS